MLNYCPCRQPGKGVEEIYHTSGPLCFIIYLQIPAKNWVLDEITKNVANIYTFKKCIYMYTHTHTHTHTSHPYCSKNRSWTPILLPLPNEGKRVRKFFIESVSIFIKFLKSHAKDGIQDEMNTKRGRNICIHLKNLCILPNKLTPH